MGSVSPAEAEASIPVSPSVGIWLLEKISPQAWLSWESVVFWSGSFVFFVSDGLLKFKLGWPGVVDIKI